MTPGAQVTERVKAPVTSSLSVKEVDEASGDVTDYVSLKKLPEFQTLNARVMACVQRSSYWERYGLDLALLIVGLVGHVASYWLLASSDWLIVVFGVLFQGWCQALVTIKAGHNAVHGSLVRSPALNKVIGYIVSDFFGTFSTDVGWDIHIRVHHPHTNIIGLGDSSTWRAPFVPNFLYMFVTPLLTPFMVGLVSLQQVVPMGVVKTARYVILATLGVTFNLYMFTAVSQLSWTSALLMLFVMRNWFSIPYIHVNIFQHIGLPMYSPGARPSKLYLMTSGVLNLPRNVVLDHTFGHGIISSHVEHHLFPTLSDNMCLKIKPIVRAFAEEHGLPYHEDSYLSRTREFLWDYDRLMVNAPPITRFVGLQ